MYCVTIKEGELNDRMLFFYDKYKAITKMKELLQNEINTFVASGDVEIDLNFDCTSYEQLQAILDVIIWTIGEDKQYNKYSVRLNKIVFEDIKIIGQTH